MRTKFVALTFAALIALTATSLAPAPAAAQHSSCGGSVGEGCWSPRQRQQQQRQWGLPEWKPQQRYGAPVLQPRVGHQRGHNMRPINRSHRKVTTARSFTNVQVRRSSFVVPTGQIMVYRGTCMQNRRTGEMRC